MTKNRMEAFSDGVIAILITIMVLELKVPQGHEWSALGGRFALVFSAYVLSFVFLGIYWNNHHHMLHAAERTNGAVLWANLHLLFWLSLLPVATHWIGEGLYPAPTAAYGIVCLGAGAAYAVLQAALVRCNGPHSRLAKAVAGARKEIASTTLYVVAVLVAFLVPVVSAAIYVVVAALWLVPDSRIERAG
jgi:uncharacterized membrane protein